MSAPELIIWTFTKVDKTDGCRHKELHKVTIPAVCTKGWYRSIISLNAFCHGLRAGCMTDKTLWYGASWREHLINLDFMNGPITYKEPLPLIEHNSLWDFYKYIEYDYKTKKYLNGEKICRHTISKTKKQKRHTNSK